MNRVMWKTMILFGIAALLTMPNDATAVDLDISHFKATPRVRLARDPEIHVSVTVENTGEASGGTVIATLEGVQNFKLLYTASIEVYDEPGRGRTAFEFEPILATQAGDIAWTLEIHDDDPDVDQATDVTEVIWRVRQPGNNIVPGDFRTKTLNGVDLAGVDLRDTDLRGSDLSYATGLAETIGDATTLYDDQTDFTGTGFDPAEAGWTNVSAVNSVEELTIGKIKSRYSDQ